MSAITSLAGVFPLPSPPNLLCGQAQNRGAKKAFPFLFYPSFPISRAVLGRAGARMHKRTRCRKAQTLSREKAKEVTGERKHRTHVCTHVHVKGRERKKRESQKEREVVKARTSTRGREGTSTRDPNADFIELRCYTVEVQSQLRAACASRDVDYSGTAVFTSGFASTSHPREGDPSAAVRGFAEGRQGAHHHIHSLVSRHRKNDNCL